jgi:glycosyltransferase involved in cell wall biosynthesis
MNSQLISVVIPVYNERNTVGEVVRRVRALELPHDVEREIIVVDDGSNDGTDKVLRALEDSTVRVVRHAQNLGQGAAVRTGLDYVRGGVVVVQDADLEYDPADIPRIVQPIFDDKADVVLGGRFHQSRSVMPLTFMLMDRAVSIVACLLYNTSLSDVETGCRAFSTPTLSQVDIESDRFNFGQELIAKLQRQHARFVEVPVTYSGRIIGRKSSSRDRVRAMGALLRYRVRRVSSLRTTNSTVGSQVVDLRDSALNSARELVP